MDAENRRPLVFGVRRDSADVLSALIAAWRIVRKSAVLTVYSPSDGKARHTWMLMGLTASLNNDKNSGRPQTAPTETPCDPTASKTLELRVD